MPRIIMIVNEGEPREIDGVRVTARFVRARGRRIRLIFDIPPKGEKSLLGNSGNPELEVAANTDPKCL